MSVLEIAQKLDAAIKSVAAKKDAFDKAVAAVSAAEAEYKNALASVKSLHQDYQDYVSGEVAKVDQVHK